MNRHASFWLTLAANSAIPLVVIGSGLVLMSTIRGILTTGETMSPEGWMLQSILRVRDGAPLYTDFGEYPFVLALYTPLYYWLVGGFAQLGGWDVAEILVFARAISALAAALSALAIVAIARSCGASNRAALVGAGLFVTSFALQPWAYTARPDMLALALSLAGVLVAARSPTARGCACAAALLAAAFFAKQSYIVAVGALTLAFVSAGRFRAASTLAGIWIGVVGGGMVALELASGRQFSQNAVAANALPWTVEFFTSAFSRVARFSICLGFLAWLGWRRPDRPDLPRCIVGWYAPISLIFAVVTTMKAGAIYNYFLEPTAALAILSALGWDRLAGWAGASGPRPVGLPDAAGRIALPRAVAIAVIIWAGFAFQGAFLMVAGSSVRDSGPLVELIREAPGDVLTERDSLAVLQAGKPGVLADVFGLALLGSVGRWDAGPLNEMIERRHFALIVLRTPVEFRVEWNGFAWWPPGSRERIREHYQFIGREGGRYFYAPAGLIP